MNLRLVQFSLGAGKRAVAEDIADQLVPHIRQQPGCQACEFFANYEAGDYGLIVLWESKQAADSAAGVIGPILMQLLNDSNSTNRNINLYDIYEPR